MTILIPLPPCPLPAQDLADSKRINSNVHGVSNDSTPLKKRRELADIGSLTATVVSALFWPQLPQEELKLPREVLWMALLAYRLHSVLHRGEEMPLLASWVVVVVALFWRREGCDLLWWCVRSLGNAPAKPSCPSGLACQPLLASTDIRARTHLSCLPCLPLPLQIQSMLDTYGAKYNSLKVPRKLQWKPNLGQVTLDVSIGGQVLEFQVRVNLQRWREGVEGCTRVGGRALLEQSLISSHNGVVAR